MKFFWFFKWNYSNLKSCNWPEWISGAGNMFWGLQTKKGWSGSKMGFFNFKKNWQNISAFLHRVMVAYWFKIDLIDLHVEKSSFEIFGLKVVQNDQNEVSQVL